MSKAKMWESPIPHDDGDIVYYKKSVSKFMHRARTEICQSCEFFANGMCLQCGCPLDIKIINAQEQCPIHKW